MEQVVTQGLKRLQRQLTKVARKKFGRDSYVSFSITQNLNYTLMAVQIWENNDITHTNVDYHTLTRKQVTNWIRGL